MADRGAEFSSLAPTKAKFWREWFKIGVFLQKKEMF